MSKKEKTKKKRSKWSKFLWSFSTFLFIALIVGGYFFFRYVSAGLPSLAQLENPKPQLASNVYSSDGELIGRFFRENRVYVPIDSISPNVINALIATEDRDFYHHWGVDLTRFVKAMIKNIFFFKREGASTITQQLAKNLFDLKSRHETLFDTIVRKAREWITAVRIEKTYTKQEILEMYLNISYFGRGAHGIEVASKTFFNKKPADLTIPEAAVLVGLLKSSVIYDPVRRYQNALHRRNLVMHNMYEVGTLSLKKYDEYKKQPIHVSIERLENGVRSDEAPHFVESVRKQLVKMSPKYGFNIDRKSTRLNSSHTDISRMPSSA